MGAKTLRSLENKSRPFEYVIANISGAAGLYALWLALLEYILSGIVTGLLYSDTLPSPTRRPIGLIAPHHVKQRSV